MAKKLSAKAQAAKEEAEWRARSDLDTLRNAENIRLDAARMRAAATLAKEEQKALEKVARTMKKTKVKKKK